jgi:hypothetical protein
LKPINKFTLQKSKFGIGSLYFPSFPISGYHFNWDTNCTPNRPYWVHLAPLIFFCGAMKNKQTGQARSTSKKELTFSFAI